MTIFKAYELLIEAQAAPRGISSGQGHDAPGAEAPWLSTNIYRIVSRTSDLLHRFARRRPTAG